MKYVSLLAKIHEQSGLELTGADLYSIIRENFSHPKALQLRKMLLESKLIEFVGFDKKDARIKLYRVNELDFKKLVIDFVKLENKL